MVFVEAVQNHIKKCKCITFKWVLSLQQFPPYYLNVNKKNVASKLAVEFVWAHWQKEFNFNSDLSKIDAGSPLIDLNVIKLFSVCFRTQILHLFQREEKQNWRKFGRNHEAREKNASTQNEFKTKIAAYLPWIHWHGTWKKLKLLCWHSSHQNIWIFFYRHRTHLIPPFIPTLSFFLLRF